MKYISEERLRELFDQYKAVAELNCNLPHFDGMLDMLEMVIDECQELNQWQPIETAPKDRWIVVINAHNNYRQFVVKWRNNRWYYGDDHMSFIDRPTHWMEQQEPPK